MKHLGLEATLAIAVAGLGLAGALPARSSGKRPTPPNRSTELQREIAAHNEAVEKRKAEKKACKLKGNP